MQQQETAAMNHLMNAGRCIIWYNNVKFMGENFIGMTTKKDTKNGNFFPSIQRFSFKAAIICTGSVKEAAFLVNLNDKQTWMGPLHSNGCGGEPFHQE